MTDPTKLSDKLEGLSEEKRALLAKRLAERAAKAGIGSRPDAARAPLSGGQEEIWLLEQMSPGLTAYNLVGAWRVRGAFDETAWQSALNSLVSRHESLRTTFKATDRGGEQCINAAIAVHVDRADLSSVADDKKDPLVRETLIEWGRRPFDLAYEQLYRAGIITLGADDRVVFVMTHHLVSDGVSNGVLFDELAATYKALKNGHVVQLPPVSVQYGDYAAWERGDLQQVATAKQREFWRTRLADAPEALAVPTDRPRGTSAAFTGGRATRTLSPAIAAQLRSVADKHQATPFMVLLAAFSALLARYSMQDDIVIGVPVAGRARAELAKAVGMYTNTIALRTDLSGDPTFATLISRARASSLDAFDNQDVPFANVVAALREAGRAPRAPVFQVMFALQNHGATPLTLDGVTMEPVSIDVGSTKFDLTLLASERTEGLRLTLEYRADLYDQATVERMLGHLVTMLTGALANPELRVAALPLADAAERELVVETWNDTARAYPDTTLSALLDDQHKRTPNAPAVTFEGRTLTYAELHEQADCLANSLRASGVGAGVLVAVAAERSHELVIALVAVLKAGGTYVPLDPDYPADRLAFMLDDAAPAVLLTQQKLAAMFSSFGGKIIAVDQPSTWPAGTTASAPIQPGDAAYMIYTSGSTGRPKGALNAHRGIVNRLVWMQEAYQLTANDSVLQKTPYSFDVSVWEFFWPLLAGARLVVARPGGHRDPAYLAQIIADEKITTLHFVPSMLQAFLAGIDGARAQRCASIRNLVCSGEALTSDLVGRAHALLPNASVHNLYGPTECAVDVTHWTCTPDDGKTGAIVPIGRPVANTQVYVLDAAGGPTPVGVPGELFLAGVQVGLGYHKRPDLTAERFVADPFSGTRGARMYKTGDRARWRPDGVVEFLGRLDDQIKLRGFRIELGEVQAAVERNPAVEAAAAVLRPERGGMVAAYAVPNQDTAAPIRRIWELEKSGNLDGITRHELPNGMVVCQRNRRETDFLYREIYEGGGYLRHGLSVGDGDVVFDVGANIGLFTIFAGTEARGTRVYSFEPIPPVAAVLQANATIHGVGGRVFTAGLGSKREKVTFTYYPNNTVLSGRFANTESERDVVRRYLEHDDSTRKMEAGAIDEVVSRTLESQEFECEIRTLTDVMQEEQLDCIDLLKVDVERAEWDVLMGIGDADWAKIRQVTIEVHDHEGRLAKVLDLLKSKGFECVPEEDTMLAGTGLWTVFGKRPGMQAKTATKPAAWSSESRLRADIIAQVGAELPAYMVPSAVVLLPALPLTASGKLDRRALPAPALDVQEISEPPSGPVEEVVAMVWKQVLGVPDVGRTVSFHDLGGHSLLMATVTATITKLVRVQIPIGAAFEQPTVAGMASALVSREAAPGQMEKIARLVLKVRTAAASGAAS